MEVYVLFKTGIELTVDLGDKEDVATGLLDGDTVSITGKVDGKACYINAKVCDILYIQQREK